MQNLLDTKTGEGKAPRNLNRYYGTTTATRPDLFDQCGAESAIVVDRKTGNVIKHWPLCGVARRNKNYISRARLKAKILNRNARIDDFEADEKELIAMRDCESVSKPTQRFTREGTRAKYAALLERCEFGREAGADEVIEIIIERDYYKAEFLRLQRINLERQMA